MRIALLAGSTYHWLAGHPEKSVREHSWASNYEDAPQAEAQLVTLVRATHAKEIDRGNLLRRIAFSTTRLFATPAEAELWCHDYEAAFPRSGTLLLDSISPLGVITRRQLANARVAPPRRRVTGASVLLDYSASGGEITAWTGTAPGSITVTGALTSNGSTPVAFSTLLPAAPFGGRQSYTNNGLTTGFSQILYWDDVDIRWKMISGYPTGPIWSSASNVIYPQQATGWAPWGFGATNTGTPVLALNP
jgi:hypothetical protein